MNLKKLLLNVVMIVSIIVPLAAADMIEDTFRFEDIDSLEIDSVMFDVSIEGTSGDDIEAVFIYPDDNKYYVETSQRGNTLSIEASRKKSLFSLFSFNTGEKKLILKVPSRMDIKIETTSGDIEIKRIISSDAEIASTSGEITMRDVGMSPEISSTSGDIEIDTLVGDLSFDCTSGSVDIKDVMGNIEGDSTSGDILIDTVEGDIRLDTVSGEIEMELIRGDFRISTTSGDIDGSYITVTDSSRFNTTSGSINIELAGDFDDYRFDLSTVSGDLEVLDRGDDKKLEYGSGNINISASSISGDISFLD